ncbi:uncharacterized protein HD556DRAFT_1306466 [Suillus plorans]|uniref:Uncharacterized protein n=1 Tax=Suillus plorans TaxID=116603 RepID=A0A9P7DLQ9_9AGAM|nr:uncharacterized protein HD556DRAFT_1306466 [Suillus plorans]KAG1797887.1 hypothetical protein HD556DRAFT_1306466 [Suillus plorans]
MPWSLTAHAAACGFSSDHEAELLHDPGRGPSRSSNGIQAVSKCLYESPLSREDELSKTLDEVNCLYWGGSLVGMAYTFVDEMLKTGKVSQDVVDLIPRLRVVRAVLAIPDGLDGSLNAIYLVEEKIHGRFIKYINNNSTVAADSLHGREVVIGLFLCFVQHVQYQLTNSMVVPSR